MVIKEKIKFEIDFTSQYWDQPPMVDLSIDDDLMASVSLVDQQQLVTFYADLDAGKHRLRIKRYNKTADQCKFLEDGSLADQYAIINRIIIDGIDIQNLIQHRGWYEPIYPTEWADQQIQRGVVLEKQVIGESWLSHNGTWYFDFSSPFYKFVISQFESQ